MLQDRTRVAIDHEQEVTYALSYRNQWQAIAFYYIIHVFYRSHYHYASLNEDRHILTAARCSPRTLWEKICLLFGLAGVNQILFGNVFCMRLGLFLKVGIYLFHIH